MSAGEFDGYQDKPKRPRKPPKHDKHGRVVPLNPALDVPMKRFREGVDMDALELFLESNEKYTGFLLALRSPDNAHTSFPRICRAYNISLHELQVLYNDGQRNMGLLRLSSRLPQIMADVGEDALSRMETCGRCDGEQTIVKVLARDKDGKPSQTEEKTCPACKGVGEIRVTGDKHARDLVFESMKLTGQKGPLVAINQNFGAADGMDAKMETMLKLTQSIAVGGAPESNHE